MTKQTFADFKHEVDKQMEKRTGIGIEELSDKQLQDAYDLDETPTELIDWYIQKYGLIERERYVHF